MPAVLGQSRIGGQGVTGGGPEFFAHDPARGEALQPGFHATSSAEVDQAVGLAKQAGRTLARMSAQERARGLEAIAAGIEALGDVLIERAALETGLPTARLQGERGRTCGQLRMFAAMLRRGEADRNLALPALPDRAPMPRPRLELVMRPLGPVVVFGASNFPLAFSTAGGDTAAALAAGCPVIVRAHPAHPGTAELVGASVDAALAALDWPRGSFALLQGEAHELGAALVQHPDIRAVAFTGSQRGGRALLDLAAARPEPIPVFAEMGSINPVFVSAAALVARGREIGQALAASVTQGVGQFCTKPGVIFVEGSLDAGDFRTAIVDGLKAAGQGTMLTSAIAHAYAAGVGKLVACGHVQSLVHDATQTAGTAYLGVVSAVDFARDDALAEELFGPATLIVQCEDIAQVTQIVASLPGQLSGTLHVERSELDGLTELIAAMEDRVGRICWGGVPTGVEVCEAMHHGGPYPATTDPRFTSVGTRAIERFMRPLCRQGWPSA